MANNRMFLVNKRTGARVFLAKYYPGTGWYSAGSHVHEAIDAAFEADEDRSYAMWGDLDWEIAYECDTSAEGWKLRDGSPWNMVDG